MFSPDRQWDLTVELVAKRFEPGDYALVNQEPGYPIHRGDPGLGALLLCQARISTRLYLRGDVVVGSFHANDVRQPVWGVSSRGYRLHYYWVDLFRTRWQPTAGRATPVYETNRSHMRWVELPGELVGRHPVDPDVRSFVIETLRAGDSEVPSSTTHE